MKIDPADGDLLVELVFYCTMEEDWDPALEYAHRFLSMDGRENAGRLQVGLLTAEILYNMGRKEEALAELENLSAQYRRCLVPFDCRVLAGPGKGEIPGGKSRGKSGVSAHRPYRTGLLGRGHRR